MITEMDHPKLGKIRHIGMPIKLSETPGQARTLGVTSGGNTDEVLSNLGYIRE